MSEYSNYGTAAYKFVMKEGNFAKICYLYLQSKAFKENVVAWILKRWKNATNKDIVSDLFSLQAIDIYGAGTNKHTALSFIAEAGKMNLIPISIFKTLPHRVFKEKLIRSRGPTVQDQDIVSLKEYLLWKRNCPKQYKEVLKKI